MHTLSSFPLASPLHPDFQAPASGSSQLSVSQREERSSQSLLTIALCIILLNFNQYFRVLLINLLGRGVPWPCTGSRTLLVQPTLPLQSKSRLPWVCMHELSRKQAPPVWSLTTRYCSGPLTLTVVYGLRSVVRGARSPTAYRRSRCTCAPSGS